MDIWPPYGRVFVPHNHIAPISTAILEFDMQTADIRPYKNIDKVNYNIRQCNQYRKACNKWNIIYIAELLTCYYL